MKFLVDETAALICGAKDNNVENATLKSDPFILISTIFSSNNFQPF